MANKLVTQDTHLSDEAKNIPLSIGGYLLRIYKSRIMKGQIV